MDFEGQVFSVEAENLPTISVDGGTVMVTDARVVITDIEASNGTIHVIDAVLIPPTS